jgi:hypothetical protein
VRTLRYFYLYKIKFFFAHEKYDVVPINKRLKGSQRYLLKEYTRIYLYFYIFYCANNPVWHGIGKQEKCSTFLRLNDVKITRFISIFTSKRVWKFLEKIQLTKSDLTKTQGGKCPAPCQTGLPNSKAINE